MEVKIYETLEKRSDFTNDLFRSMEANKEI